MLQLKLNLAEINYESILKMVYPTLLEKVSQNQSRNLLFRLITELGNDGEGVLLRLIEKLPSETCSQLVCHFLNSYSPVLIGKLNDYLREDSWGKHFVLDRIEAEQSSNGLVLTAQNVQADFKALLNAASEAENLKKIAGKVVGNGLLGAFAAKAAAKAAEKATQATSAMAPEELEAAGVAMLNRDAVRQKLMEVVAKALNTNNIPLAVSEIQVESTAYAEVSQQETTKRLELSGELENALIKALADFLREV